MNLKELKITVMHQTGGDEADLPDHHPYLTDYLNDGYDRLVYASRGQHVTEDSADHPPLKNDRSAPDLPQWAHGALADWASWLILRNGGTDSQSRGLAFRRSFENTEKRLRSEKGSRFRNLPR